MSELNVLVGTSEGIQRLGGDETRYLHGHSIDHIVATPGGVWAIADGDTLWRGADAAAASPLAKLGEERANCLLVREPHTLVGASGAALFELAGDGLRRVASFDAAPGRAEWYTPWGGPPDVRSMAGDEEGRIYVNVHVGGVVCSSDGGATWSDTMDIHADVHEVIADPQRPGHAYAATARGLAVTTDGAATWRFTSEGLHGSYARAVALSDGYVFVSASLGSRGEKSGLYRAPLGRQGFERCAAGLPEWFSTNLNTFCLAARGAMVVAGDAAGAVYVSDDEGETWTVVTEALPDVRCLTFI